MKSEEDYVTIRVPRQLADEIDKIIQSGKLGYRTRAEIVKEAIRLRIEQLSFNNSTMSRTISQKKDDDFLIRIKETFLVHTLIKIAKETTLPPHHLDLKQLEQNVRRYIMKRANQEGKKITNEHLDELTEDILNYHKEIVEGLALMSRH